jgi:hypothetical protein
MVNMTESIPSIHEGDAASVALPPAVPKPTSLTGQTESSLTVWTSDDGRVETGVWECDPGTFTARRDGYDEVAQILVGRATVEDEHGQVIELVPGSIFVTPSGWAGSWTIHETMRKTYVIRTLA